jgi:hypothetical protein
MFRPGAWLIGNIWYDVFTQSLVVTFIVRRAILHDPDVYPEPEVFNPERFLDPDGTLRDDPTLASVFGFGKRICPGRHLVDATLFIFAVTVLSVLHIEKGRDPGGGPFQFTYSSGLVRCVQWFPWIRRSRELTVMLFSSRPNAFPCSITARDKFSEELVMSVRTTRV